MGGKTSSESKAKYNAKAYDRMELVVKKEGDITKAVIKEHAAKVGESVNAFVTRAIKETMERDSLKE